MGRRVRGRMVLGICLVVAGLFATVAGLAVVVLLGPDGSVGLPPTRFLGTGVALTLPQLDVPAIPAGQRVVLDVAIESTDTPIFVGIGPSAAVETYLRDAPVDVIQQIDWPGAARTERVTGAATPAPPGTEPFWVQAVIGTAPRLHWVADPGDWTLVIMRADAQPSVDVTLTGRVTIAALGPIGFGLLAVALAMLGVGAWLLVRAAKASPS